MRGRLFAYILAAGLGAAGPMAAAQEKGALTSTVELEKISGVASGKPVKSYVTPDVVVPGDRVRVTLLFANPGSSPATGVRIVNPIPAGLVFDGTDDRADFSVSVDGGKSFGDLAGLTLPGADGSPRAATDADVTHVRWLWSTAVPAGGSRSVAFFGRVK